MKYEVIDNFLDEKYFDSLVKNFEDNKMSWFFEKNVAGTVY